MHGGRGLVSICAAAAPGIRLEQALVFIVVTIDAQKLPIAAIRRVIVMIVVAVVDRELLNVVAGEFPSATPADPWIELERLLAVALFPRLPVLPGFGHQLIQFAGICLRFLRSHGCPPDLYHNSGHLTQLRLAGHGLAGFFCADNLK